jgi:adenine-specific DNA-methyltransferase
LAGREVDILALHDETVGPAFEILRRACQPEVSSVPHLTVKHSRATPRLEEIRLYDQFHIDRIHLEGPGSFDYLAREQSMLSTVFIQCASQRLEMLSYKPDFPNSVFHLTIYDGEPSKFAADVLKVLAKFPWHLDVPLPATRVAPLRKYPPRTSLSPSAQRLWAELPIDFDAGRALSGDDATRLEIVRVVCEYVHSVLKPDLDSVTARVTDERARTEYHQEAFWSVLELVEQDGSRAQTGDDLATQRLDGVFLTPPEIAFDLSSEALELLEDSTVDFGDPALGSGIFVASVANILGPNSLFTTVGVEDNPARALVTAERWRTLGLEVAVDDFVDRLLITSRPPLESNVSVLASEQLPWEFRTRNLIVTNPPYVRSQRLDPGRTREWRKAILRDLGVQVSPRSDMYVYFILAAQKWLRPGGISAWLLPTEFMATNYGQSLRDFLANEVTLLRIHVYDGGSRFANARVTSCAVIFQHSRPSSKTHVEFSRGGSLGNPQERWMFPTRMLQESKKWNSLFAPRVDVERVSGESYRELGELFRVKRGVATGANSFFILSDEEKAAFGGLPEWYKPVFPRPRELRGVVVEGGDDGVPLDYIRRWLIDCDLSIGAIESKAPVLANYLRSIEPEIGGRSIVGRRKPFYKQESSSAPKFLFKYMAKSGEGVRRFILNRSDGIALNNYLCLYPTPEVERWVGVSRDREVAILNLLNEIDSGTMDRHGRTYVEGLTKIEPSELRSIKLDVSILAGLAAWGSG